MVATFVAPTQAITSPLITPRTVNQNMTQMPPTLVVNLPPAKDMLQIHDPPPPYPGLSKSNTPALVGPSISGGPSHGYGEGRGHYNRQNGPSSAKIQKSKNNESSTVSSASSSSKNRR